MTTGERLSEIMTEKGVSVRELARETGLSLASVRRLRRGRMEGNLYSWALVAKALGVSVDDFISEGFDERN